MADTVAWRCTVCGYVHRGARSPEECPVCGSPASAFEPYADSAPVRPTAPAERWTCENCSYVHDGAAPPDTCPVCGADKDRFAPAALAQAPAGEAAGARTVVIVGACAAGVTAAAAVRRACPDATIILLSKEDALPYYRLNLTRYLAGEIADDTLPLHPAQWYTDQRIDLRLGVEVSAVRPTERDVELRSGERIAYDQLILATGAHPFVPPLPGAAMDGVASLRTADDARKILRAAKAGAPCVCIGGGLLGIETAAALARQGADVSLLEGHPWLMPRQLNRAAGEWLGVRLAKLGIKLRTQANTAEIVGDERVAGVLLKEGQTLPAGLVVLATGVRPNSYLARRAGMEVNKGVVVDHFMGTSAPGVLAAGDVAEHRGVLYGHWAASQFQGEIAGMNAAGGHVEFGGLPASSTLKVVGAEVVSVGMFEPEDASFVVIEGQADETYRRFIFHDGRMVGAVLMGDASVSAAVTKAVQTGADFSALLVSHPQANHVAAHLAGRA